MNRYGRYKINILYIHWVLLFIVFIQCDISFAHFPKPNPTHLYSNYVGQLTIFGVPAEPGDEIAFFDPQDVLCGLHIVTTKGQYGIVHIFGDDPDTKDMDEGAVENDPLRIRIWDASEGVEHDHLTLSAWKPGEGTFFQPSAIPPLWKENKGFALNIDTRTHFPQPVSTPYLCKYLGNILIQDLPGEPGDEIAFYDPSGVLCGTSRLSVSGQFGVVHIYGDDPSTVAIDEGAETGDILSVRVWDQSIASEIPGAQIQLTSNRSVGTFVASGLPPVWTEHTAYVLDVDSGYDYQHITLSPEPIIQTTGSHFSVTAIYNVSNHNQWLEGIGIRFHYDDSYLTFNRFDKLYPDGLFTVIDQPQADVENFDKNSNTNKFVTLIWKNDQWPGIDLPLKLAELNFTVNPLSEPGMAELNVTFTESSNNYFVNADPAFIHIHKQWPDVPIHFTQPIYSPRQCVFAGNILINGMNADPGDEIAFFDPQGVLCGRHIVSHSGLYGIVQIYGDVPETDEDEGASHDDILSLRIWDASEASEIYNADIVVTSWQPISGSSFIPSATPPIWQRDMAFALNIDTRSHFSEPVPTPLISNYIGNISILGNPAEPGDEIAVFDPQGILCGHTRIGLTGKYGVVHIYGNDPSTPAIDEGAETGDILEFQVWDKSTGVLLKSEDLTQIPGAPMGSYISSSNPPTWAQETGYVLNLEAGYSFQSIQLSPDDAECKAGNELVLTATYLTSDENTELQGVGARFHYQSLFLSFVRFEQIFQSGLETTQSKPVRDDDDFDQNELTDQYISVSWHGDAWPGNNLPVRLLRLVFRVNSTAKPETTRVNVSFSKLSSGYKGESGNAILHVINPAGMIKGRIHYTGQAKGMDYVGAWLPGDDWQLTQPIDIVSCTNENFLIRLPAGAFIIAAYRDTDQGGNYNFVDIDDHEPYGFYSDNTGPEGQNGQPTSVTVIPDQTITNDIKIYDWPYIQRMTLQRHHFPGNYPDLFPPNHALFVEIQAAYRPGNEHIQTIIKGYGSDPDIHLSDSGQFPDMNPQDGMIAQWINMASASESGLYTVQVTANELIRKKMIVLQGDNLETVQMTSPSEITNLTPFFSWASVAGADNYQLHILKTDHPTGRTDYLADIKDIVSTEYEYNHGNLIPDTQYYYYVTASDPFNQNVSYSAFQSFVTDGRLPEILDIVLDPKSPVPYGLLNVTIQFTEPLNTNVSPTVYINTPEKSITGDFETESQWSGQYEVSLHDNGLAWLTIENIMDKAGNIVESIRYNPFVIDTVLPRVVDVSVNPSPPVKVEMVTFTIHINDQMDTNVPLQVTFGESNQSISGDFTDNFTWVGQYQIKSDDHGIHELSIKNGKDVAGNPMMPHPIFKFEVDTKAPSAPTDLSATQNGFNVSLAWTGVTDSDVIGYHLYRDGLRINADIIQDNHYSDEIKKSKTYAYHATAIDQAGNESVFSQQLSISTSSVAPMINTPVSGTIVNDIIIGVRGESEEQAFVEIWVNGISQGQTIASHSGYFSKSDIQLIEGENQISAIAINSYGIRSPESQTINVILNSRPSPPKIRTVESGDTTVTITWTASTEMDISGYHIYRNNIRINNELVTQPVYTDTRLINGKNYLYTITAVDQNESESNHSQVYSIAPIASEAWNIRP